MAKKFEKDLFERNDPRGRAKAIEILSRQFDVVENPDQYGVDLLCYKKGTQELRLYVEVEVRGSWTGNYFPFSTAHIPARKKKFFVGHDNVKYFQFNNELSHMMLFDVKDIRKCAIRYGSAVNEGNFGFYDIPTKLAQVIDVEKFLNEV